MRLSKPELTPVAKLIVKTVVPVYLLVMGTMALSFHLNTQRVEDAKSEAEARIEGDRAILVQRTVATCEERNLTKEALRGTIDAALAGSGRGDLTQAPSFDRLPPDIQQFVREISVTNGEPSSATSLRVYRETLLDEDCKAVGVALEKSLLASDQSTKE